MSLRVQVHGQAARLFDIFQRTRTWTVLAGTLAKMLWTAVLLISLFFWMDLDIVAVAAAAAAAAAVTSEDVSHEWLSALRVARCSAACTNKVKNNKQTHTPIYT